MSIEQKQSNNNTTVVRRPADGERRRSRSFASKQLLSAGYCTRRQEGPLSRGSGETSACRSFNLSSTQNIFEEAAKRQRSISLFTGESRIKPGRTLYYRQPRQPNQPDQRSEATVSSILDWIRQLRAEDGVLPSRIPQPEELHLERLEGGLRLQERRLFTHDLHLA